MHNLSNMINVEPADELANMETAGLRSCSSSSTSSFDSCSDLLGLMDTSAHSLDQAKERQQEDNTIFERFAVKEGYGHSADAKHLRVPRNGYGSFEPDQNGGLVEGLIKQAGSSRKKRSEGNEPTINAEPHTLEQQAMEPVTAIMQKPTGSAAFKKGAQISCSSASGFDLAAGSVVLPKADTILQEVGSHSIDLVSAESKGSDSPQQNHSFRSEHAIDARNDKQHHQPHSLAKSTTDMIGSKNINSEGIPLDYVNQTHNHNSKVGKKVTLGAEADNDLQQLENSIKFFDLYKTNASFPHLLGSTSSRRSSPDLKALEQIDLGEFVSRKQSHTRSLSSGMIKKEQKFASAPYRKLKPTGMHSWIDSDENGRVYPSLKGKKDEIQYEALKKESAIVHYGRQGRGADYNDSSTEVEEATLAQTLDMKRRSSQSMISEELLGEIKRNRKSSSDRKSQGLAILESTDLGPDELSRYLESLDVDEKYMDALMDIKNPLLNVESEAKVSHAANHSNMSIVCPTSDDTLSTSTSGLHILNSHNTLSAKDIPFVVDSVEVVGARQKRGGSSVWERMVGVKDHTVYCIKVVSGKQEWEVLRRYRDFKNFYQQLKRIFNGQSGSSLFLPLEEFKNDSRQIFGNTSPNVVQARTICIEKILQSLLQAGPPFSTASPVFWFLRPPQGAFECTGFEEHLMVQTSTLQKSADVQLGNLDPAQLHPPPDSEGSKREKMEDRCPIIIGKTIKLILVIHQNRSLKQVLNAQHYSCAGCYRHLDYDSGLIKGFAQTFGRGRPRFCEYTGQLFCSSCHLNEFSVLPAYVLWHWDFTPRRVSQLAKAYLDSIYDQPLLCVRTINPYLYQRVHCLRNVKETRIKLSRVFSCIRCPSRARILHIMGLRRYFLENNDFFALRDLEDLSKGAFAVLPGLLAAVLKTLVLHVTKQCSVCQDSGEWCGAGIMCEDPFHPIFPFNEEANVVNCKMCNAPFHQKCFAKCVSCPSCPQDWVDMKHTTTSGKDEKA